MKAAKGSHMMGGGLPTDISSVGVAAHELKSPLALLRQLSFELANNELTDQQRQRVAEQLIHISDKALRLTTDITRAERLQSSLFPLEPVNPLSICEEVTTELKTMYNAHGRSLALSRQKTITPVIANRDLLRRILLNFADNALHYADTDGRVRLEARLQKQQQTVRVGVRDYGPALSLSNWRRIVASIDHRDQPVHARPQSSGLGMYIAQQFAVAMNGRIGAVRHHDGASFYVELPISQQLTLL